MKTVLLIAAVLVLSAHSVSVQVQDASKCNLCKAGVTELKVMINDKDTKDLIGLLKTWICANVPIDDCDNWMTNELAQLESTIADLDPATACTSINLCSVGTFQDSVQCDLCEFLGDEIVKRVLTNATIDEVLAAADKVCSELPFISNECSALVKEYGHYYLELLVGTIDVAQLCSEVGLCSSQVRNIIESSQLFQVVKRGLQDDEGCKACTDGMDIVKEVISSKDTLDLLHIAIHEICGLTSVPLCETIADTALDQFINKVVPAFDPVAVCKEIGACPALEIKDLYSPAKIGDDSPVCQGCHDLFGEIKKAANDPATKDISKDLGTVICDLVSIPFCQSLINKFLEENLEKAQNLDVDGTCVSLGACASDGEVTGFGGVCDECAQIADLVVKELQDPDFQQMIEEAVDQVCTILPIPDCKQTVDTYVKMLETLIGQMDGKTLCSYLGLCSSKKFELVPVNKVEGIACSGCEMASTLIAKLLKNPIVTKAVEDVAKLICIGTEGDYCYQLFDMILGIFEMYFEDAKTVCTDFGLCSSKKIDFIPVQKVGDTCSECTMIAGEVITLLENEQVDALIKEAITEVCTILPISNCEATIDGYFDQIVALVKNLPPKTLCSLIGLC